MKTTDPNQCTNRIDLNRPAGLAVKCASVPLQLGCVSECIGKRARPGVDRMNRQMQSMMCDVDEEAPASHTHRREVSKPVGGRNPIKNPLPSFQPTPTTKFSRAATPSRAPRGARTFGGAARGLPFGICRGPAFDRAIRASAPRSSDQEEAAGAVVIVDGRADTGATPPTPWGY